MRHARPRISGFVYRVGGLLLVAALAGTVAVGCTDEPPSPDGKAAPSVTSTVTPEQARTALRADLVAVAEAAMPGRKAAVNEGEDHPVPCGGLGGNERSRLLSSLEVVIGDPKLDRSPTEVLGSLRKALEARGWKVGQTRSTGDRYELVAQGPQGSGVTVIHEPGNKSLQLLGETECLPNPDA